MFDSVDFEYVSEFVIENPIAEKCLEALEFAMSDHGFTERGYEDSFDIDSEFTLHVARVEEGDSVYNVFQFSRKGGGKPVHYEEILHFCEAMVCLADAEWVGGTESPFTWRFKVYIE